MEGGVNGRRERRDKGKKVEFCLNSRRTLGYLPKERVALLHRPPPTSSLGFLGFFFFPATGGIMVRPKYVDEETHR